MGSKPRITNDPEERWLLLERARERHNLGLNARVNRSQTSASPCSSRRQRKAVRIDAPDLPPIAPAYASLFAEGCFGQRPMIAARDLREMAVKRGIAMPLFPRRDLLEPLDGSGGFSPLGFLQTNVTPETVWLHPDPGLMAWREERNFEPWDARSWDAYGEPEVSERYSPWQLLYLDQAIDAWDPLISARALAIDHRTPAEHLERIRVRSSDRLRAIDESWRPLIKLLIALQPRFWPYRRQATTLLHEPGVDGHVDPLQKAIEGFDPFGLLRRFGLSLDQLARLHLILAETGRRLDPMPRWYRLGEAAPRTVTDELRAGALRARDFYDASFLLRRLYHHATEKWLPRGDELLDARTVNEHRRRHLPRPIQPQPWRPIDLKGLLIREGLYPHRIHFFVEGETEAIVLSQVLPLLGFEMPGSGMAVTNIHGVDQAERYSVLFASATEVAARTVLVADLEGTLAKILSRLREDGLFADAEDCLLWSKDGHSCDFEEANFSEREILNAIQSAARRRVPGIRVGLDVATLRRERIVKTRPRRPPPALAKLALKLVENEGIRVSKPELAKALTGKLIREIRRSGHLAEAGKRRPILAGLWLWLASERTAVRPSRR